MARALALTAGLLAAGCSPFGGGAFTCEESAQCNAAGKTGGRCEPNGYCSYADPSCTSSGQRYDDHSADHSGECVGGGGGGDGGSDICYGFRDGLVRPCFPKAPTGAVTLQGTIDTGMPGMCSTDVKQADGLCVIAGETILVESMVRAIGSRPLVLVATKTIEVGAAIDAASHRNGAAPYMNAQRGAGSDPAGGCEIGAAPAGSGGGAGGSLIGLGGLGGSGGGGGTGGTPGDVRTVATLRGGCKGQDAVGAGGKGGLGGGAVYLIAETSITIAAPINASGEGGHPGLGSSAGAGGGGSGGMIGLDSPMIINNSVVFANGASGGEGSGMAATGSSGNPGPEPADATPSLPATGGTINGGDGGRGSGGAMTTGGNGVNGSGGGGAGGGGIGVIRVFRGALSGAQSPIAS